MPETVDEWIRKADGDYRVAVRESEVADGAAHDAVCFHAHQCIEKLMKAALLMYNADPPRTHNLMHLDEMLHVLCPAWQSTQNDVEFLTRTGIAFRYPGEWATPSHATKAMSICDRLRESLLKLIGEGKV